MMFELFAGVAPFISVDKNGRCDEKDTQYYICKMPIEKRIKMFARFTDCMSVNATDFIVKIL